MIKHKWWHQLFTEFLEENKETVRANHPGASTRIKYWTRNYYCHMCKEQIVVDLNKEADNNG